MWQADITHWPLAGAGHAEILNMLDDHSRLFVASVVFATVKATDVVDVFRMAIALHGAPASLLCDNGAVFTATPRGGKVLLQAELERLGIAARTRGPPPPDLRQGRAPAPDAQALPGKPVTGEHARRVAGADRRLHCLLQREKAPQGPRRAHAP
jgi:Integrase core domain